jgi:hypothetical protein
MTSRQGEPTDDRDGEVPSVYGPLGAQIFDPETGRWLDDVGNDPYWPETPDESFLEELADDLGAAQQSAAIPDEPATPLPPIPEVGEALSSGRAILVLARPHWAGRRRPPPTFARPCAQ